MSYRCNSLRSRSCEVKLVSMILAEVKVKEMVLGGNGHIDVTKMCFESSSAHEIAGLKFQSIFIPDTESNDGLTENGPNYGMMVQLSRTELNQKSIQDAIGPSF